MVLHYKFISTLFRRFTSVRQLSARSPSIIIILNSIVLLVGFAYGLRLSNSSGGVAPLYHFRRPGPSGNTIMFLVEHLNVSRPLVDEMSVLAVSQTSL